MYSTQFNTTKTNRLQCFLKSESARSPLPIYLADLQVFICLNSPGPFLPLDCSILS